MAEGSFRTLAGVVQFEPREGTAGGKDVRNITIRTTGLKEQSMRVGATLWPSHAHVEVDKGDFVVLEGKFSRNQVKNKDGEAVTYNNLSVSSILVVGTLDDGEEIETTNAAGSSVDPDDDIPY